MGKFAITSGNALLSQATCPCRPLRVVMLLCTIFCQVSMADHYRAKMSICQLHF